MRPSPSTLSERKAGFTEGEGGAAVGGGGLLAGVASAIKALRPSVRVLAAEPETAAPFTASLADRFSRVSVMVTSDVLRFGLMLAAAATIAGEVQNPGLGPLHTEFDGKGNAYSSMFVSSEVVKWSLKDFKVKDRIPGYYSIGHLMIPGGDTKDPNSKYLLAMNKITKDRYLPTGPELAQAGQLIDISGEKMKMLLDFPTFGEPHYAQAIKADVIQPSDKRGDIGCACLGRQDSLACRED